MCLKKKVLSCFECHVQKDSQNCELWSFDYESKAIESEYRYDIFAQKYSATI